MRLVVHMGATKTASSLLQRCLFRNEGVLRTHGVYLPKAGRLDPSYSMVAHHNLGWQLLDDPSFREAGGTWTDLAEELAAVDAETVLLSSEAFARLASDPERRTELSERLRALSDDVTLVYVVRDPLARINSMFKQTVKAFGTPSSFDDYAAESIKWGYYNLEEAFHFWYESNPVRFLALPFDEMVDAAPLVSLLAAVDVAIPANELVPCDDDARRSPGPVAIEAMRLLNVHLRVIDAGFSRRRAAARRLAQIAERRGANLGWYDDEYWGWSQKQATWAAGKLEASNQAFAHAVWGTDWPLASLALKPEATVNLIRADRKTYNDLLTYVQTLTSRYLKLAAAGPRVVPVAGEQPAVDGPAAEEHAAAASAAELFAEGSAADEPMGDESTADEPMGDDDGAEESVVDGATEEQQVSAHSPEAADDVVIDASTLLSDEAERAALAPPRRPSRRTGT